MDRTQDLHKLPWMEKEAYLEQMEANGLHQLTDSDLQLMKQLYQELMQEVYPEEMEPGRMLDSTTADYQWMDQHPEKLAQKGTAFQDLYARDKELAIIREVYNLLRSFA